MKSVDTSKYDREYFTKSISTTLDNVNVNHGISDILINIFPLNADQRAVDFGCGSGLFSFLLNKTYNCEVVGVDYSEAAVELCNENNEILQQEKVSFVHSNIVNLPAFKKIDAVYFADVIEHLYDEEIHALLEKIKLWKDKDKHQGKITKTF